MKELAAAAMLLLAQTYAGVDMRQNGAAIGRARFLNCTTGMSCWVDGGVGFVTSTGGAGGGSGGAPTTAQYWVGAGQGVAGRTGTFSALAGYQAPATPVIGTWMPFQLAAGDTGIRSVQSVTLGTSYVAGALSLVLYRPLAVVGNPVANIGSLGTSPPLASSVPGVRLYNDTCMWLIYGGASATTANPVSGMATIMER